MSGSSRHTPVAKQKSLSRGSRTKTAARKRPRIHAESSPFPLRIRKSRLHGFGVFATGKIPANRKVIEYTGKMISTREANDRDPGKVSYLFALNRRWVVDGSVGGSGAEYINHSCEPNIYIKILKGHILYMSKRPIAIGEELTVDYRFSPREVTVPCHCVSSSCRGTINLKRS
jgi:SET domain-containing protein